MFQKELILRLCRLLSSVPISGRVFGDNCACLIGLKLGAVDPRLGNLVDVKLRRFQWGYAHYPGGIVKVDADLGDQIWFRVFHFSNILLSCSTMMVYK